MDYLYANPANERIMQGCFPKCSLQKHSQDVVASLNYFEKAKDILIYFKENPDKLYDAISSAITTIDAGEHILDAHNYEAPFNLVINTSYNPAALNIDSPACQEAIQLCPVVTSLDKALWVLISTYAIIVKTAPEDARDPMIEFFFAWMYLLKIVQENELIFGKTLDFSSVKCTDPLFEIIMSPWNQNNSMASFVALSASELDALNILEHTRKDIKARISMDIEKAKTIAVETEQDWDLFLQVLNDYSEKEAFAVSQVCSNISKLEKLSAIKAYLAVLQDNFEGYYQINGERVHLTPVINAIEKRLRSAAAYCVVQDTSGAIFRLHQYAYNLLYVPFTFNLLLLYYHQWRLEPQKDNALIFFNYALHCLKCNLFSADGEYHESINIVIERFHHEFLSFIKANQDAIDNLSFDDIQQDTVYIGDASLYATARSTAWRDISNKLEAVFQYFEDPDSSPILQNQQFSVSKEQLDAQFASEQERAEQIKVATIGRQAVVSLNIVYLFCDAITNIQESNQESLYFENAFDVAKRISELRRCTNRLSYAIYSGASDIDEYRRQNGIETKYISERESKEDDIRSVTFTESIFNALNSLQKSVGALGIEELLALKTKLQDEVRKCSICSLSERFTEQFISISNNICRRLVDVCHDSSPDFDNERKQLLERLDQADVLLPPFALNSLTTAELLYHQFASDVFALKGFDYSCISALYYQAFEEAYNKMIWVGYANLINSEAIGDRSLCSILFEFRDEKIPIEEAKGYLSQNVKTRACYLDYTNKEEAIATAKPYCMYKNFALLLYQVKKGSPLKKLCDYFAELTGFSCRDEMFEDSSFMDEVRAFAKDIDDSSRCRNNASHGGTLITIEQCQKDKHTVLSELDELHNIRESSIGLIQKLLHIMSKGVI